MKYIATMQFDADGRPEMASGYIFDEHAADVRWCRSFDDEVTEEIPIVSAAALAGPALWSGYTKPNRCDDFVDLATTQPLRAIQ